VNCSGLKDFEIDIHTITQSENGVDQKYLATVQTMERGNVIAICRHNEASVQKRSDYRL
jgi:hypothetical protein